MFFLKNPGNQIRLSGFFRKFVPEIDFLKEESPKFFKKTENYHNSLNHENEKAESSPPQGREHFWFYQFSCGCGRPSV